MGRAVQMKADAEADMDRARLRVEGLEERAERLRLQELALVCTSLYLPRSSTRA